MQCAGAWQVYRKVKENVTSVNSQVLSQGKQRQNTDVLEDCTIFKVSNTWTEVQN